MPIDKVVNCMFKDAHAQRQNPKIALLREEEMMPGLQCSVLSWHSSAAQSLCVCCRERAEGAFVHGKNDCCEGEVIPRVKGTSTGIIGRG